MAIKESDIKKLFKTIMQDTMKTVSAGRKTVIALQRKLETLRKRLYLRLKVVV